MAATERQNLIALRAFFVAALVESEEEKDDDAAINAACYLELIEGLIGEHPDSDNHKHVAEMIALGDQLLADAGPRIELALRDWRLR